MRTIGVLLLAALSTTMTARPDRRVVDTVRVGNAKSEEEHAYAGRDVTTGVADGRAFRQTRSWLRYALTVFDDTEVTIACTFVGSDDAYQTFDLVVENMLVTTYSFHTASAAPMTVELRVPIEITRGRTNIMVVLRASNGMTPALVELRSIQEHNE